jgi:hypothetical protein
MGEKPRRLLFPQDAPFFENANFSNEVIRRIKLRRIEDVMGAVVFLASDAGRTYDRLGLDARWRLDDGITASMLNHS